MLFLCSLSIISLLPNATFEIHITLVITFLAIGIIYFFNLYCLIKFNKELQEIDIAIGKNGFTKLMAFAIRNDLDNTIKFSFNTENVNAIDEKGYTALMYACANGNLEIVELLLEYGADSSITTSKGNTALYFAERKQYWKIIDLLRINGTKDNEISE